MTLAVKVALNPNTINNLLIFPDIDFIIECLPVVGFSTTFSFRNKSCLLCSARDRSSVSDMQQDREFRMNLETLPGQVDDVHSQCQQLYGKESFMCVSN